MAEAVDGVRFFGVEVGVVRIGNSAMAPVFNVVVRPNDLQKAEGSGVQVSDVNLARRAFLDQVMEGVAAHIPGFKPPTGPSYQNSVAFRSGPFGYFAIVFTREQQLRIEAYLDCGDRDRNKRLFDEFFDNRGTWEQASGLPLVWDRLDEARASRIAAYDSFWLPGGEANREAATQEAVIRTVGLLKALEGPLRARGSAQGGDSPECVITAPFDGRCTRKRDASGLRPDGELGEHGGQSRAD